MFSATRLIAVVALVVLGVGSLLFAAGQGPSPVTTAPPVASSLTPAPSTASLTGLLSRLATEEVAPGVFRLVNDGYRDLSAPGDTYGDRGRAIAAGPDGSVWVFGLDSFFRLGEPKTYPAVETARRVNGLKPWVMPPSVKVGPDGTLWALYGGMQVAGDPGPYRVAYDGILRSFDGTTWTDQLEHVHALDITPDGVVWTTSGDGIVGPLGAGGRTLAGAPIPGAQAPDDFAVAEGGVAWIHDPAADTLVWVTPDGHSDSAGLTAHVGPLHRGPGGTIWAYQEAALPTVRGNTAVEDTHVPYFVRFDPSAADNPTPPAVYTQEDGVPLLPNRDAFEGFLGVSPDGSLWMTGYDADGWDGLQRWDEGPTTTYLEGIGVVAFAIGPDGTVWVQGHDGLGGPVQTYAIPGSAGGPP